ncbi:hypothetical protein MY9_3814 [Bacillus sp. JS]|nr:hypothetical protein MY9_3814 [Bacillus sp. JS]
MNYVTHSAFFTKCSHKGEGRIFTGCEEGRVCRTPDHEPPFHSKIKKPGSI